MREMLRVMKRMIQMREMLRVTKRSTQMMREMLRVMMKRSTQMTRVMMKRSTQMMRVMLSPTECPGGADAEEPRDGAAARPRLGGPGGGASGRPPLRRVRPQEGRLPGGVLREARPGAAVDGEDRTGRDGTGRDGGRGRTLRQPQRDTRDLLSYGHTANVV